MAAQAVAGRARVAAALLAVGVLAAGAAAIALSWPFERGQGFLDAFAIAATVVLVVAVVRGWPAGVAWGAGVAGAEFVFRTRLDPGLVAWTPVAAAMLLLAAELALWSYELDGVELRPGAFFRRLLRLIGIAAAGGALTAAVQVGGYLVGTGWWLLPAGAVAAALLLWSLPVLARR